MEDWGRFESLSLLDGAPFGKFNVLMKQSYRVTSRQCLKGMYETMHNKSRAVERARRRKSQIQRSVFGAFSLKKRVCKRWRGILCARLRVSVAKAGRWS